MLELMIVVVISVILLSIAAPNFGQFIQNTRIRSATEDLLTAINVARTEALKRGEAVILCRTGSPNAALGALACGASTPDGDANTANDWSPGWIMYAKPEYAGTGGIDYDRTTDGDPIMVGNPSPKGVTVTADGDGNRWLAFFGDGTLNESGAVAYAICDNRGTDFGREITIPLIGRPNASDEVSTCNP